MTEQEISNLISRRMELEPFKKEFDQIERILKDNLPKRPGIIRFCNWTVKTVRFKRKEYVVPASIMYRRSYINNE